ncbi:MAG TPA: hypothetical protein EYN54_05940, partial [Methylococcaceae bacterium]|nr:hypothetical protein [Methylococcaceae bacterium]
MTITVAPARNEYTANAAQTIFNYTFKIFADTDLNVYITPSGQDANDSADLTTAYTVTGLGDEDGGTIILSVGTNANDLVTIVSDVPSSRTIDYQNNGDFRPNVVNNDFDRVVSIVKKIEDTANRTVLLQQSQQDPKPLTLPSPIAGFSVRWNGSETGLENYDASSSISNEEIAADKVVINYSTLLVAINDASLKLNQACNIAGRNAKNDGGGAMWDVYPSGTFTLSSYVVAHDTLPLQLALRREAVMDIRAFGVATSEPDNATAVKDALTSGVTKLFGDPSETYLYTTDITVNNTDINMEDVNLTSVNGSEISFMGNIASLGQLTSGGEKGTRVVGIADTSSLSEGDLIIVYNSIDFSFSKHRASYTDGEFNRVTDKTVSTLITESLLKGVGDYPIAATTIVYKVNPIMVNLTNCKFRSDGNGALYALTIANGVLSNLNNCSIRANDNDSGALNLIKCYGVNIVGGDYFHEGVNVGLNYGIAIINCEQVLIMNADLYATRHAVTTGDDASAGSTPCRRIHTVKSKLGNNPNALIFTADFHGNTADSSYEDCEISGAAGLAGENITFTGNTVTPRAAGIPIQFHELVGGDYKIYDNKVVLADYFTGVKIVAHGSSAISANIDRSYHIDVKNLTTDVRGTVTEIMSAFCNAATSVKSNWTIDGLSINPIDDSGLTEIINATVTGTGIRPDYISLENLYYSLDTVTGAYLRVNSLVAFIISVNPESSIGL